MHSRMVHNRLGHGKYLAQYRINVKCCFCTQCSKTCDGVQTRKLHCKLGNETLSDERCPDSAIPSKVQSCGPKCQISKTCSKPYCHKDELSQCQISCCDYCNRTVPSLPLIRYNVCEKPCCEGTQSWKDKGCT